MNIFVLDNDPRIAAKYQCDTHVVKMTLETAQLLCSVHETAPYKRTHYNHPCTIWTRSSRKNYEWLIIHGHELAAEYNRRFNRTHKSLEVINWCANNIPQLPDIDLTPFAQAMPIDYQIPSDAVSAYRIYYIRDKATIAKWKHSETPKWFIQHINDLKQE